MFNLRLAFKFISLHICLFHVDCFYFLKALASAAMMEIIGTEFVEFSSEFLCILTFVGKDIMFSSVRDWDYSLTESKLANKDTKKGDRICFPKCLLI